MAHFGVWPQNDPDPRTLRRCLWSRCSGRRPARRRCSRPSTPSSHVGLHFLLPSGKLRGARSRLRDIVEANFTILVRNGTEKTIDTKFLEISYQVGISRHFLHCEKSVTLVVNVTWKKSLIVTSALHRTFTALGFLISSPA